jgi:hypothetical protein
VEHGGGRDLGTHSHTNIATGKTSGDLVSGSPDAASLSFAELDAEPAARIVPLQGTRGRDRQARSAF